MQLLETQGQLCGPLATIEDIRESVGPGPTEELCLFRFVLYKTVETGQWFPRQVSENIEHHGHFKQGAAAGEAIVTHHVMAIPPRFRGTMASLADSEALTWQTIRHQLVQPMLDDAALAAADETFLDFD